MTAINITFLDSLQTPTDAVLETIANLKDIDLQQKIIQLFQNKNREGEVAHPPLFSHRISLIKKSLDHQAAWLVNPILESFSHEELHSLWKDLIKAIMEEVKGSDAEKKLYQRIEYVVRIDFLFTQSAAASTPLNHKETFTQLIQFFIETYPDLISILINRVCEVDRIDQAQSSLGIEILSQLIPSLPTDFFLPLYTGLTNAYVRCERLHSRPTKLCSFLENLLYTAPLNKEQRDALLFLRSHFQRSPLSNLSTEEGGDLHCLSPWNKLALFRLAHGLDSNNSPLNAFSQEYQARLSDFYSNALCTNIYSLLIAEDQEPSFKALSEALALASDSQVSYNDLADRIKEGKLTIIPGGHKNHAITLCFGTKENQTYLLVCNNGEGRSHANITAFPIDRSKINPSHLLHIGNFWYNSSVIEPVSYYLQKTLPSLLANQDRPSDDFCAFLTSLPWKPLKTATCVHGSLKTAINAALACLLDTQDPAYIKWIRRKWTLSFRTLTATLGKQALEELALDPKSQQALSIQAMLLQGKQKRDRLVLSKTEEPRQLFSSFPLSIDSPEGILPLIQVTVGGFDNMDQVYLVLQDSKLLFPMWRHDLYWVTSFASAAAKPVVFSIQVTRQGLGSFQERGQHQALPHQTVHLFPDFSTMQPTV